MAPSQQSRIQRLSRGVEAAYEAFVARRPGAIETLHRAFLQLAKQMVFLEGSGLDPDLAFEIAAEAKMNIKSFRRENSVATWFIAIAKNEIRTAIAAQKTHRRRHVPLIPHSCEDTDGNAESEEVIAVAANAEASEASWDIETLAKCLPAKQFDVVRLFLQGHSLVEIAAILDRKEPTVGSQLRLAKKRMRETALGKENVGKK